VATRFSCRADGRDGRNARFPRTPRSRKRNPSWLPLVSLRHCAYQIAGKNSFSILFCGIPFCMLGMSTCPLTRYPGFPAEGRRNAFTRSFRGEARQTSNRVPPRRNCRARGRKSSSGLPADLTGQGRQVVELRAPDDGRRAERLHERHALAKPDGCRPLVTELAARRFFGDHRRKCFVQCPDYLLHRGAVLT
jgi:hypothetical protein